VTLLASVTVVVALAVAIPGATPKFYDDDPLWIERDTQDASGARAWEIDLAVDLGLSLFGTRGDLTPNVRAQNINTVDEVPDSSWFTNRIGRRLLTPGEVATGPDTTRGPAPGAWVIVASRIGSVTPGLTIRDAAGLVWFLKFDPPGYRGMATGTEVVVTKLLWAIGFHVPENHIAYVRPEELVIGDGARFTPLGGQPRAMRPSDLASILKRTGLEPNGLYRVVASKQLEGAPLGGFRFYDTRPDDPNDIVPHEHRRELRGYNVVSAWLNHVDATAVNSLDTLVRAGDKAFVRHHLLDFGSALGSAGNGPAERWEGHEQVIEPSLVARRMLAFGFHFPQWRTADVYESRSIGRLPRDNTRFEPDRWKAPVSNPAFLHARPDDRFWAARLIVAMTDNLLEAAVRAGGFDDPASEAFLVKALAERRDAIGRTSLAAVNPIVEPALDGAGILTFRNAAVDAGVARAPEGYRAVWSVFDNATDTSLRVGVTEAAAPRLEIPAGLPRGPGVFIKVELSATGGAPPAWLTPAHATFRQRDGEWRLVGFERSPEK
jgi:hypothetical protein